MTLMKDNERLFHIINFTTLTIIVILTLTLLGCEKRVVEKISGPTVEGRIVSKFYEAPYDTTDYITLTNTDGNGNTIITVIPVVSHHPAEYHISFCISSRGPFYGKTYRFDDQNLYNTFSTNDRCFMETEIQKEYIVKEDEAGKTIKTLVDSDLRVLHISKFGPLESN